MQDEPNPLDFWRGNFGNEYIERNSVSDSICRSRTHLWAEILKSLGSEKPASVLEVGANIGTNIRALKNLLGAAFYALEPNEKARNVLIRDQVLQSQHIRSGSAALIEFPDGIADLVFTSGVLIHIPPEDLEASCREIYRCSKKYIVCIEYFSDSPTEISYRGHSGLLFKRDFGGTWMDLFPHMEVLGTGFAWKRTTGLDNLTWWAFRK